MKMKRMSFVGCGALVALLGAFAFASTSQAQSGYRDEVPQTDDIHQTVARVAYFSGEVSYSRGDSPDDWQPASINFPMTLGDRLYTARDSRLELQTENGAIYLAPETDLAALNLTYDAKQFSLGMGSASFAIRSIDSGESFEVDTPNSAVTFDSPGEYRIDVDPDGNTRVLVNSGFAYVAAAGGEVPLETGSLMAIDGIDSPVYDVTSLPRRDSWDQWVETRSRRTRDSGSRRYVSPNIPGVNDLDEYGRWSQVPQYGMAWSPANVASDWQPYRAGRWAWQDPWGWSWVSNEPWGWAPYHYGRWVTSQSRWYWVPVGPEVRTVHYAPALVAFVGGSSFSLSVSVGGGGFGGGNVGWFPLAPRDPFVPWWGSGARVTNVTNVTNVTYVNRTYLTVVHQDTFVSGAQVGRSMIGDARTLREMHAAPVVRGPLHVVPLASSIRVSTEGAGSAPRPPEAGLSRVVVTRRAPPPAPALFRDKESLIRENRGAPVTPAEAARFPVEGRTIRPTRSVAVDGARLTLAPKNAQGVGPKPVPVTRDLPPGRARREAQPPGVREVSPSLSTSGPAPEQRGSESAPPADNEARRQQDSARQQQADALEASKQQQDVQTRKQQADDASKQRALDASKQQQDVQTRKQQADDTSKQRALDASKQQQDVQTRKQQADDTSKQRALDASKQQQDVQTRKRQADDASKQRAQDASKQRDIEAAKHQGQTDVVRKQQQDIQARKQQALDASKQQALDASKQQQDIQARKQQALDTNKQQALDTRKQQQDVQARKQQALDASKQQQDTKDKQAAKRKAKKNQKNGKQQPVDQKPPAEDPKPPTE